MSKLYIVSCGTGGTNYITPEAREALKECEIVVSYSKYARELSSLIDGKELHTSGMTHEVQRCTSAVEFASQGKTTCIISNGDSNVYGIASVIVEIIDEKDLWDKVELISLPGVTALLAAAAKVGAALSQDFATISLSERQNSFDLIDKRVKAALDADFILGIYNPKSKKRIIGYENFIEALKPYENRIAVIASHMGREEKESITITTAKELIEKGLDNPLITMSTLIIIGNTQTRLTKNGKVLTPRGCAN